MNSESRSFLAIGLSAAFLVFWFVVVSPRIQPPAQEVSTNQVAVQPQGAQTQNLADSGKAATGVESKEVASAISAVKDPQASIPEMEKTLSNDLVEVQFSNVGGIPISWRIKSYRSTTSSDSPFVDIISVTPSLPGSLLLSFENGNFEFPVNPRFEIISSKDSEIVFRWKSREVEVKKIFTLSTGDYTANLKVEIKNLTNGVLKGEPVIKWNDAVLPSKGGGFFGFLKQPPIENKSPVYYINGKVKHEANVAALDAKVEKVGSMLWAGFESRYFMGAIVPRTQGEGQSLALGTLTTSDLPQGARAAWVGVKAPAIVIPAGEMVGRDYLVYAGPKEIQRLKAVDVGLDKVIDYGWFTVIAIPILHALKFFHSVVNNYGVAIILLTIFVKLLLHPINMKSLKSMKKMQDLQPKLKELQVKFGNDKQRIQQETMNIFKANGANPLSGCLPMALQIPIYIALYRVLWNSIELFHAPFFAFYRDLSAPDPYLITPIVLGLFMVLQQKLTPTATADPAQRKMMMIMPVMFSVFMLFLPVGLVIYILVNTGMSVATQWLYNRGILLRDLVRGRWKPIVS